jgi:lipopolysaccharide transport system ATP-binding protein
MTRAVGFDHVTKYYLRGGPSQRSLRDEIATAMRRVVLRRGDAGHEQTGYRALNDLSFELEQGDSLALLGPNGSGKTTALKLLCRIAYPTSGFIKVRGTIGALIEVGSSIHPELTGRENVWLAAQILGMSKDTVKRRFDEIVDFAEIGYALDTQAKMYSTGMQLRLGFSIAAHLEPEIFVVDEALAVGDTGFQARCMERMTALVESGTTLIFVTHDLASAQNACRRGIFLRGGELQVDGTVTEAVRAYLDWVDEAHQVRLDDGLDLVSSDSLALEDCSCFDETHREQYAYQTGDDMEVRLRFRADRSLQSPQVTIGISDGRPGTLALCSMLADGTATEPIEGTFTVSCDLHELPLLPRVYQLWCSVREGATHTELFEWQPIGTFRVEDAPDGGRRVMSPGTATDGPVFVAHEWRMPER